MRKVILCIGVLALIMLGSSVPTFAISLGKLPHVSWNEETERAARPEDAPAVVEDISSHNEEGIDLTGPLTLEQCIEIAQKRATEIRTAQLNLIREELNVKDAASNYLPQVTTDGRYQFSDTNDFGWEKENYNASIAARYTIWDHGQRAGTLAQARSAREAEYSRYDETGQSLIYSIIRAYYDLLKAEKLVDVDKQLLEQSKQNVKKIEAFVEAGIAIEADIATARVRQATDELMVINDRNDVDLAKANLAVVMGLAPVTPLGVVDTPDYEQYMRTGRIETEETPMEDAIARAFANRPELAAMNANLAVLESALTLAQLEMWPKITADAGYNLELSDYLRERNALKNHRSWDVSARVSYPIFDGGRTRRTVQRVDIAQRKLKESESELERNITLEVYQAYLSLGRAGKSLDIARVQVEDAKMSLDVAQGRYDQQMIILIELLDAQERYARSMTNQIEAFYNYKVAEGTVEKAMGVLD